MTADNLHHANTLTVLPLDGCEVFLSQEYVKTATCHMQLKCFISSYIAVMTDGKIQQTRAVDRSRKGFKEGNFIESSREDIVRLEVPDPQRDVDYKFEALQNFKALQRGSSLKGQVSKIHRTDPKTPNIRVKRNQR